MMNISILDSATLGDDIDFSLFKKYGRVRVYKKTAPKDAAARIAESDIIIVNKLKINESNLANAQRLKLICVTATGFDNIDIKYCRENNIAVCNIRGYSTDSVAQITVSLALSLANHIARFDECVKSGSYTKSGVENRLTPVFHEFSGRTWGIIGLGTIGRRVAEIAKALGCEIIAYKRSEAADYKCVGLPELCAKSDIISIHLPLTDKTRGIVSREMIDLMKPDAVVINTARGAVADEAALAEAIIGGRLGGLGIDVYSSEPVALNSPYCRLFNRSDVIFTPHMAWGAYEARVRCMEEIALNIDSFLNNGIRNRVEL